MMRTLRARLLTAMVILIVVTIGVAGLVTRGLTHMELRRLGVEQHILNAPQLSSPLETWYAQHGSWNSVEPALNDSARSAGTDLLLLTPSGQIVARSAGLRGARIAVRADGSVMIESQAAGEVTRIVARQPGIMIRDAHGNAVGRLLSLPRNELPRLRTTPSLDRSLLWTFIAAALIAIAITLLVARRLTGPVETLTSAARRMAAGDRSVRVGTESTDEIGALGVAFNQMADAVEQNEAARRRLMSDVAHELRTPLTNIRCQLEALQDGLERTTPAVIDSMHHDAMQLSTLIADLEELSLAEAGQLRLEKRAVDLCELVQRVAATFTAAAATAGVALTIRCRERVICLADDRRISQVLSNLLANAVRHTPPEGTIEVNVRRKATDAIASVSDSGAGIAAEVLPHIFDRFYRADPSRSRATGGAGLGLAIVRQLVTAHGGTVTVASEPGRGSTFTVTLPVESGTTDGE
jgi:signal transduction histidine kinase